MLRSELTKRPDTTELKACEVNSAIARHAPRADIQPLEDGAVVNLVATGAEEVVRWVKRYTPQAEIVVFELGLSLLEMHQQQQEEVCAS